MGTRYLQHDGPRSIEIELQRKRIGELIRRERLARGITMRVLAEMIGISPTMLARYEHGECDVPAHQFGNICDTLGSLPRVEDATSDA